MTPKRINIKEEIATKRRKKCDEVFAEYIYFMSDRAKDEYCKEVISFCLMYRECLNKYSGKLEEEKKSLPEVLTIHKEAQETGSLEYCLENNAEQIPDISNEFITRYLGQMVEEIDVDGMKELTLHFCRWLFFNGYTCSMISVNSASTKDEPKEPTMEEHNEERKGPYNENAAEARNEEAKQILLENNVVEHQIKDNELKENHEEKLQGEKEEKSMGNAEELVEKAKEIRKDEKH